MSRRDSLQFQRRGRSVRIGEFLAAHHFLLDWLRLQKSGRPAPSEEGCAEAAIAAPALSWSCRERDGRLVYEPVNSCITLLGQLDGAEFDHRRRIWPTRAYCIRCRKPWPGRSRLAMRLLYARHRDESVRPLCTSATAPRRATKSTTHWWGNSVPLHRLYRPIVDAALEVCNGAATIEVYPQCGNALAGDRPRSTTRPICSSATTTPSSPRRRASNRLRNSVRNIPTPPSVAGATDVGLWITKKLTPIEKIVHVGRVAELSAIEETADGYALGAIVSLARAADVLGSIDPDIAEVLRRFGSIQVRACGTVGGNIANGSPIGDLAPMLIALGASAELRQGDKIRLLPLENFFLDYGKQDRAPGEFGAPAGGAQAAAIDAFFAPTRSPGRFDRGYFQRCCLAAFCLKVDAGRIIEARVAFGGMAGIPKRAKAIEEKTCAAFR